MEDKLIMPLSMNLQFFAQDGPGGEKTEPATAKKLKDAREEGKVAKSKELNSAFELLSLFLIIKTLTAFFADGFIETFFDVYKKMPDVCRDSVSGFSGKQAQSLVNYSLIQILKIIWPVLLISMLVCFFTSLVQVKWKPTAKPMQPKLSKLNPAQGIKKIISKDSLFELLKSIIKIVLISWIAYSSIKDYANELFMLYEISLNAAIGLVGKIIIDTGIKISIFYIVLGLSDYVYNKHKFNEDMKMTKQEVKDEFKNTEGNPEIKGRQRQVMRQASQKRMMQAVPKADVVITNPTHLAVALSYNNEPGSAPIVVAKGEDYLAMKIREVAKENKVEIVENKPLARQLYLSVDVGQEIPPELYQAVAEILAEIYRKKMA
ncbi:MAG: flagellar biosynthesis protein FlhB [Lachnospiraceae bacterium]|nr:flagellar biosynthesis protein FlhB [Lachnospiraceae bacterium]MBR0435502.1 flagellar biosynthesis protein FlhB [Lachnospiraceae bacterium]